MNKNEKPSFLKGKGAAVATVICFVAVITMVGAFTFRNYQNRMEQELAKAETAADEETKENSEETATNEIVLPEAEGTEDAEKSESANAEEETADDAGQDTKDTLPMEDGSAETAGSAADVWFSEESILEWPASGAVLINYSMDKTVYFATLEQYKYNPALIVGGEVGEMIGASAPGVVTNIEQNAQTGLTVTLDMGNGYSAIYGQLKEVPLEVGSYVNTGETIGYLSEPTKYFATEGANLYFEVQKDGAPVNPMDFMEG
mgnify:CR=1 FL=1